MRLWGRGVITQDQSIRPLHSRRGCLYFACALQTELESRAEDRDTQRLVVGLGTPHPGPHSGSFMKTLQIHSVNSIEGQWGLLDFFLFLMVHIYCSVIYSQCFQV